MNTFYYDTKDSVITLKCRALDDIGYTKHCFTTRKGGVSRGAKAFTNMSFAREDKQTVLENYRRIQNAVGFTGNFAQTYQTHTSDVKYVKMISGFCASEKPVDGLITDEKGICLCVYTADCVPILIADKKHRAISAVHSGWRGTAGRISKNAIDQMRERFGILPNDLVIAIGPFIHQCHFEVGQDVYDAFCQNDEGFAPCFDKKGEKYMFDLGDANKYILMQLGIPEQNIHITKDCTYCNEELYYSHRRNGNDRGNLCGMIEI